MPFRQRMVVDGLEKSLQSEGTETKSNEYKPAQFYKNHKTLWRTKNIFRISDLVFTQFEMHSKALLFRNLKKEENE
jgi:hypothetical protein